MAACSRPPALSKTYSGNYDRVVTSEHFSTLPRDLRAALEELEPKCTAKDEVDIEHFLDMTKVVNQMRANRKHVSRYALKLAQDKLMSLQNEVGGFGTIMVLADKTAQLEKQVAESQSVSGSTPKDSQVESMGDTKLSSTLALERELKKARETMEQMKQSMDEVDQMKKDLKASFANIRIRMWNDDVSRGWKPLERESSTAEPIGVLDTVFEGVLSGSRPAFFPTSQSQLSKLTLQDLRDLVVYYRDDFGISSDDKLPEMQKKLHRWMTAAHYGDPEESPKAEDAGSKKRKRNVAGDSPARPAKLRTQETKSIPET